MKYQLTAHEARVIGCLLEKQVTTPEQYPLSVNAVVTACNQKTNREPVMSLSESDIQDLLDALVKRHYLRTVSGFGNRVTKYEQRFCNSEFGDLKLSPAEVAVVTTLLLRGAQTPGELRSRAQRMHDFSDMAEVESVLETLATRDDGPFVARLPREPGNENPAICTCSAMIWTRLLPPLRPSRRRPMIFSRGLRRWKAKSRN
jgi:uncharacterized protein YceH (UPF0502 family)